MKNRAELIEAIQKRQKDMWAILGERGRCAEAARILLKRQQALRAVGEHEEVCGA